MDDIKFEDMVYIHGPDILKFCRLSASSRCEGDELYQDTLLTLWRKKDKLRDDSSFKSYAISTAIRIWKNKKRKYAWRSRIAPQTSYENMIADADTVDDGGSLDPLEKIVKDEQATLVRKYISELPETYQHIIRLYYGSQMSVAEIAECIHVSVNTVKTRLSRARKLLKDRLEDHYER